MSARPWWKFYISNWRGDARLTLCTARARGVWLEMLLVMVEADPIGHLVLPDGLPMTPEVLAESTGLKLAEVQSGITELERNKVFDRLESGIVVSRKMVRDARKSEEQRARVAKRWNAEKKAKTASGNTRSIPMAPKTEDRGQNKKRSPKGSRSDAPSSEQLAFDAYNEVAGELGLLTAKVLTPERRKKLHRALHVHGALGWTMALDMLRRSPFATGAGSSGWKMDLADMLDPEKFNRLLEGGYTKRERINGHDVDNPQPTRAEQAAESRRANMERAFSVPVASGGPGR